MQTLFFHPVQASELCVGSGKNTEFSMAQPLKKEQAKELFVSSGLTQKAVADRVGVPPKTVSDWVNSGDWNKLRQQYNQLPMQILVSFESQLSELTQLIDSRPPGQRIPTFQEARLQQMIIRNINNIRSRISCGPTIDVLVSLVTYIAEEDPELAEEVRQSADKYVRNFMAREEAVRNKMPSFRLDHPDIL